MINSLVDSNGRKLAIIALATASIAVSACEGHNSGDSPSVIHALAPEGPAPAPTYTWGTWKMVTPGTTNASVEVTGINNLAAPQGPEIVGFYTRSTTTNKHNGESLSFTSYRPYNSTTDADYPRVYEGGSTTTISKKGPSTGTEMNAIATQSEPTAMPILAGNVNEPGLQGGTFAVVDNQGLWGLVTDSGKKRAEIYGINDSEITVGWAEP